MRRLRVCGAKIPRAGTPPDHAEGMRGIVAGCSFASAAGFKIQWVQFSGLTLGLQT